MTDQVHAKLSNCNFLQLCDCSLRLLSYRDLLPRLASSSSCAVHNKHIEVSDCCLDGVILRESTTHLISPFALLSSFPHFLPHQVRQWPHRQEMAKTILNYSVMKEKNQSIETRKSSQSSTTSCIKHM